MRFIVQLYTEVGDNVDINDFGNRLAELRAAKNVSAREMSLSLGQSVSYINQIENHLNFPSMTAFFYICEFLGTTPKEFFSFGNDSESRTDKSAISTSLECSPYLIEQLVNSLNKCLDKQIQQLINLLDSFND